MFAESGTGGLATLTSSESVLPVQISNPAFSPTRIVHGHDGNIWFSSARSGALGRLNGDLTVTRWDFNTPPQPSSSLPGQTRNWWAGALGRGPDLNTWYLDDKGKLSRITHSNGVVDEFSF
jgi:streptogramin lyase